MKFKSLIKKTVSLLMVTTLAASILTGCGSKDNSKTVSGDTTETATETTTENTVANDSKELTKLTFGTSAWPTSMFGYLADELGYFEKKGIEVDMSIFSSYSDSLQAFVGGNLDIITSASSDTIAPFSQGADFNIIMLTDKSLGSDGMVSKPDIQSVSDLKGKTVATELYSVDHMYLLSLLDEAGLSADDVTLTNMTIADAGTAFIAGRVDAAVIWEPYLSKAVNDGGGKLLYSTKDNPDLITDCVLASTDAVANKSEAIQAFVDSWYEAVEYWKNNEEDAESIMAKYLEVTPEEFHAMMETLFIATAKDAVEAFEPTQGESTFVEVNQKIAEFLKDLKVTETIPNISDMINTEFIKNSPDLEQ